MMNRRILKVGITFEFLLDWLTQDNEIKGTIKTTKGLPKDAKYISSWFDEKRMEAFLIFEHESFPLVKQGEEIPFLDIHIAQIETDC